MIAGARRQSAPPKASPEGGATPKLAEQEYKNVQALKGIPAEQIIPAMQFIAASLGVECEYCHVPRAFEKDDKKPKVTARKMIGMMMAINKENFEGHREVTCYSCHRGSANPVATPIISAERTETRGSRKLQDRRTETRLSASGSTPRQICRRHRRGRCAAKSHQPRSER